MSSDPPEERAPGTPTKVVYVMGAGRSGSTILGVALGNCDGVCFAGELDKWLVRSGTPKLQDEARVQFWSRVAERVPDGAELYGHAAHGSLERSSALFRRGAARRRRRLKDPYLRVMSDLYRAVAETAGAEIVVDTSHYPLRARALGAATGIELHLVMLVRDPRDVVASFARADVAERRFSPATTCLYLLLTYAVAAWVFARQPRSRRLVLRYEDFLADPSGVLRAILTNAGSAAPPPDFSSLRTGLPLHGNRLLSSAVVSLERGGERPARAALPIRVFARLLLAALAPLGPRVKTTRAASSWPRGR